MLHLNKIIISRYTVILAVLMVLITSTCPLSSFADTEILRTSVKSSNQENETLSNKSLDSYTKKLSVLPLNNMSAQFSSFEVTSTGIQNKPLSLRPKRKKRPRKTVSYGISPSDGFFRSILLPGWGQFYSGRKTQAAIFVAAEVSVWTGLIISQQASESLKKNYEAFAAAHAGFTGDKDHKFYVDIGNYDNRDDFNEAQRGWRQYEDQYRGDATWWEWDSSENRETFKEIRIKSDRHKNNIYYFIGGLLINRLISGIEASRGINKQIKEKSVQLGYDPQVKGPSIVLTGWLGK